ncbi:MAG: hypothetical protein SFX73_26315 [Kofleriaceae bacterium]|nr:hypothetical protein [Kofleriaceae bacterium]
MHKMILLASLTAACATDQVDVDTSDNRRIPAAPEVCAAFELVPDERNDLRPDVARVTPEGAGAPGTEPSFWSGGRRCQGTVAGPGMFTGDAGGRTIKPGCLLDLPYPTAPSPTWWGAVSGVPLGGGALEIDGRVWSLTEARGQLLVAYRTSQGTSPTTAVDAWSPGDQAYLAEDGGTPWILVAREAGSSRGFRLCIDPE